jgi:hypothetical protein
VGVHTSDRPTLDRTPWRLLLWTAVARLVFGLIGFGELAEDKLRASRNNLSSAFGQRRHRPCQHG